MNFMFQVSHEFIFWCTHWNEQMRDSNGPTGTKGDLLAPDKWHCKTNNLPFGRCTV